jgi:type IV pilus assembly protein PilM
MPSFIGLDIGTSAVRAVQLNVGRSGAKAERLGQVRLPQGAIRDGEVVEPASVAEALRTLWSDWGFKGKKVALGLANQQVVVRQVDLPYMTDAELRDSLQFQVQEFIPIPLDQATLDFHVIEEYESAEGQRISRVLVVAAQKTMVDAVLEAVSRAKLEPVLLDLDAFALLRALAPEEVFAERGGEMLIDVGAAVTNVVVHQHGIPRFVRVLLMGGQGVTEGLMSALGQSYEEAEQTKGTVGLPGPGAPVPADDAARIVAERANRFVEEIRGSLDYYAAQTDAIAIDRVVLAGGGALLSHLRDRLAQVLRLPVEFAHPLQHLSIGRVGLDEQQLAQAEPFLSVAIGLALGAAE